MDWAEKENIDWSKIVADIQSAINANKQNISAECISDIQHYLDHGEYAMAFEFLYLEIIENKDAVYFLGKHRAEEIGRILDLDKESHYDQDFWRKFEEAINKLPKSVN